MEEKLKKVVAMIASYVQKNKSLISDSFLGKLTSILKLVREKLTTVKEEVSTEPLAVPETDKLLWILAGGEPEAFVQYLQTFPDGDFTNLLRNPAALQARVQELQRMNLIDPRVEEDGIPEANLESSTIQGFKYDPRNKKLKVKFQGDGIYEYDNVPGYIFNVFQNGAIPAKTTGQNRYGKWWRGKNPSLGAAMHQLIKLGGYPYRKIR